MLIHSTRVTPAVTVETEAETFSHAPLLRSLVQHLLPFSLGLVPPATLRISSGGVIITAAGRLLRVGFLVGSHILCPGPHIQTLLWQLEALPVAHLQHSAHAPLPLPVCQTHLHPTFKMIAQVQVWAEAIVFLAKTLPRP